MSEEATRPTTALVVPVGPYPELLDDCLAAVRRVDIPFTEVIVVDDSTDSSLPLIPGVRVVRSRGVGPYGARNTGWEASTADVIFFCDVRCRPRTNWTSEMLGALDEDGVVLVGSDVWTLEGRSLASRAASTAQPFLLSKNLESELRPYFPNCNMAVHRSSLELVGGFPVVRSGGDALFCWSVVDATSGRLHPIHRTLMDWVPRRKVSDFLEQSYRYGKGACTLGQTEAAGVTEVRKPLAGVRMARWGASLAMRSLAALVRKQDAAAIVLEMSYLAFEVGYRREHRSVHRLQA